MPHLGRVNKCSTDPLLSCQMVLPLNNPHDLLNVFGVCIYTHSCLIKNIPHPEGCPRGNFLPPPAWGSFPWSRLQYPLACLASLPVSRTNKGHRGVNAVGSITATDIDPNRPYIFLSLPVFLYFFLLTLTAHTGGQGLGRKERGLCKWRGGRAIIMYHPVSDKTGAAGAQRPRSRDSHTHPPRH